MKKIIPLLTLFLINWGCQPTEPQHPIVGDWSWIASTGGIAGWTVKPKDNDERILRFTADGKFEVYNNNVLFYSGHYRLTSAESIYNDSQEPSLIVDNFVRHEKDTVNFYPLFPMSGTIISKLSTKELELADNCYDCYGHLLRRKSL